MRPTDADKYADIADDMLETRASRMADARSEITAVHTAHARSRTDAHTSDTRTAQLALGRPQTRLLVDVLQHRHQRMSSEPLLAISHECSDSAVHAAALAMLHLFQPLTCWCRRRWHRRCGRCRRGAQIANFALR